MMEKRNVLFIHQAAELYGSDKVLLYLVEGLAGSRYNPIVLLPSDGPLKRELEHANIETHVLPVTKISRATFSLKGILTLPFELIRSVKAINKLLDGRKIHLVHSNTVAVLSGAIWARLHRVPHLWHVHEMIVSPTAVKKGFPFLLRLFSDRVVCNSTMTQNWVISEQHRLAARSEVIWNGLERRSPTNDAASTDFRHRIGAASHDLVVTLMGRFNRWKGQAVLVDAATLLWDQGIRNIRYVMVGSPPPGQEHFLAQLRHRVEQSPARSHIVLLDFLEDIWPIWDATDIAVVPSTEPEPFGLVAIEAMAAGKPVVAASHGGLLDIVQHGVTGLHSPPGDASKLADALRKLIKDDEARRSMGIAGQQRQQSTFSLRNQIDATIRCYDSILSS